ncbi:MAG TPA: M56 family metallopeptidase, partial [Phycisphaerae bacterium]|nr:M56 family metallopeptidase [Phycisphaerae bacterium]
MNAIEELFGRMVFLRIGWALLHFVWQGAVVAAGLAVALRLMRYRSPNARYLCACAAAVLLAALVPLTAWQMPLPGWSLPSAAASAAPLPAAVSAPLPAAPLAPAIPAAEVARAAPPAAPWTDRAVEALGPVLPYIVTAWIAGVALMSLWRTAGWVRVHRLKLSGSRGVGEDLSARLAGLARRLGVTRPVRLMRSALATTPTVIGWLRPVLLLPASAVTGLTAEKLEAVLAHELAHVRRHDYLVNLLQTVVETLLFYHPAVWWVSAQIRAERENCCDDVAAEACGGRYAYAEALVAIASLAPARPRLAIAATGGSLLARIRRLLGAPDDQTGRSTRWLGGAAAMATVLCLTLAVTLTHTPAEPAEDHAGVVSTRLPAPEKLELSVQDGKLRVEMDTGEGKPPAILELSADGVVCTAGTGRIQGEGFHFKKGNFQLDTDHGKLTLRMGGKVISVSVADGEVRLQEGDPAGQTRTTQTGRRMT